VNEEDRTRELKNVGVLENDEAVNAETLRVAARAVIAVVHLIFQDNLQTFSHKVSIDALRTKKLSVRD